MTTIEILPREQYSILSSGYRVDLHKGSQADVSALDGLIDRMMSTSFSLMSYMPR